MKQAVKQYGLRRTGTNLLAFCLSQNYSIRVHVDSIGWKHGVMRHHLHAGKEDLPVVIMTRHPLAWLPSMHRVYTRFYRGIWSGIQDFEHFIHWRYSGGRACPFIVRWSFAYGYWLWRNPGPIIRYEDLFVNPELTCEALGFERTSDEFKLPEKYVAPTTGRRTPEKIKEEYDSKAFMSYWTDELITEMEKGLDLDVLEAVGYSRDVREFPEVERREPRWHS